MRRKLTGVSTIILALRKNINFNYTMEYVERPLPFLFRQPSISTSIRICDDHLCAAPLNVTCAAKSFNFRSLPSSRGYQSDVDLEFENGNECGLLDYERTVDQGPSCDAKTILDILSTCPAQEKCSKLDRCGVKVTHQLVSDVISRTRNDWEKAFTFFLWAGRQPGYMHSLREFHSMIAILGKFRKFDTAWNLINDMQAASLLTPRTILIMIWKYAAVHDVAKAISAFYAHKRYKFEIGLVEFQGLLSALCRYKNVKDAEHLLFCNQTVFPLNAKSFNIILNGWFNLIGDSREGNRVWREMERRGIRRDVYSYSSIMSCYSKVGNLNKVFRLFDEMKALGIEPDKKVYNAVILALAKGGLQKEARNLMKTMDEKGFTPDSVTYNSLIMPLCKSKLFDEAKLVFDEMIGRRCFPTIRTYHAFFRILRTGEQVFELLQKMYLTGCHPTHDTYIMLIRKFCRWRQLDNVFKLWREMSENGLDPDRSSYIVLIHGLFLNGKLEEAFNYYQEMKAKHLLPEPKTEEMLQDWMRGKKDAENPVTDPKDNQSTFRVTDPKDNPSSVESLQRLDIGSKKEFSFPQPELRSFRRERGFSFPDN
ncbi:pentatricopeptide repeat-containing family protein [Dorcoceras hygrometricum]|uniref:Pentatricopeptide repeat-containing family protein n=1 Tax=Dorcoceras hygrometricum TaxID=472368 RepID=A0A2Z7ABC0_9LAMI|nr:pentatricopeptide repeat-containing family protein [Dorcoceras hygrometricum]